jgi:hypothetical protein
MLTVPHSGMNLSIDCGRRRITDDLLALCPDSESRTLSNSSRLPAGVHDVAD